MRIGILSDSHFMLDEGNSEPHFNYGTTRCNEILTEHLRAFDVFRDYDVKAVIHAGDLGHNKQSIPIPVWLAIGEMFRQGRWPWYIVPGNHGAYTRVGDIHLVTAIRAYMDTCGAPVHALYGAPGPKEVGKLGDGAQIWGIAFHADNRMDEFFEKCARLRDTYKKDKLMHKDMAKIVVLHQGLKEAKIKSAPIEVHEELTVANIKEYFDWADLIIVGHYHDTQRIGKRLLVPGAVCQHGFKDADGKRGFWIYDTIKKGLKFFEAKAPKFHVVDADSALTCTVDPGDRVRATITNPAHIRDIQAAYKDSGITLSFTLMADTKDEEKVRDAEISFTSDDYDNLVRYVDNEAPESLNKDTVKKFGKSVIEHVTGKGDG